jgi:hypothetical protein
MESLLLLGRALASPTMCRFIPALSDPTSNLRFLPVGLNSRLRIADEAIVCVRTSR